MTKVRTKSLGRSSSTRKLRGKVFVAVPSTGTWRSETGRCLVALFAYMVKTHPEVELLLGSATTSMLVKNRHDLCLKAIQRGCTHILFIDADMTFPPTVLEKLLSHRKAFVGVNATTRTPPVRHIAHDLLEGKEVDSRDRHGIEEVQHVGLAVALISTDLLKKMRPPLFMMEWIPSMGEYCGEDIYFCALVQQKGERVYIDHDLSHSVGHVGSLLFGPGQLGVEFPGPTVD